MNDSLKFKLKIVSHILLFAIFIWWTYFLFRSPLTEIVGVFGALNGYAVAFIVAFLAGLSTFISIPYYLIVAVLAAGGLNPILLGITAGIGVMIGDSTSYFLGYRSNSIVPSRLSLVFKKFYEWLLARPSWLVYLLLFLYGILAPLPNDFVVIPLGAARYPYWRLFIPLGLGNIIFNVAVATLGIYGWHYFVR